MIARPTEVLGRDGERGGNYFRRQLLGYCPKCNGSGMVPNGETPDKVRSGLTMCRECLGNGHDSEMVWIARPTKPSEPSGRGSSVPRREVSCSKCGGSIKHNRNPIGSYGKCTVCGHGWNPDEKTSAEGAVTLVQRPEGSGR